jgi:hypothetical protein
VNLLVICHGDFFNLSHFPRRIPTRTIRCITTLAGNFPFALGAATFGNVVYEDRLLNISSEKPVSVVDIRVVDICFSYLFQQADGEVGDRLSGKMRVFAFGDGSNGCCGTLSILQTQSENLQTICRDESGRYVNMRF